MRDILPDLDKINQQMAEIKAMGGEVPDGFEDGMAKLRDSLEHIIQVTFLKDKGVYRIREAKADGRIVATLTTELSEKAEDFCKQYKNHRRETPTAISWTRVDPTTTPRIVIQV